MRKSVYIIAIILFGSFQSVFAQDDDIIDPVLIYLKAKLVNKEDSLPVPYAHVINMRTHGGTTSDANGKFTMEILNVDSLVVSVMGYKKEHIRIPRSHHQDSLLVITVTPIRYAIGEVEVKGETRKLNLGLPQGNITDVDPELRGEAFNEKPKWYQAALTPVSFMYYHLSRSEKEKRAVREAMITEADWERLSQFYNKEMVMNLTGLTEDEADLFMIWFNSKFLLHGRSTEYDVREAILREFENYKQEMNKEKE